MQKGTKYRTCRRCGVAKALTAYRAGSKRPTTCRACIGKRERKEARQRAKWEKWGRDCPKCGKRRKFPDEISVSPNAVCIVCTRKRRTEWARDHRDPDADRMATHKWRRNNPEKYAESWRKYNLKRQQAWASNPKLYEEYRAARRMEYMLRRERNGAEIQIADGVISREGPEVPAAPLLKAIERLMAREGVEILPGSWDSEYEGFCESIGISDRTMRDLRAGTRKVVRLATVDRVLTNTTWHWWDVWSPGDEGYELVERLFEGEQVAA